MIKKTVPVFIIICWFFFQSYHSAQTINDNTILLSTTQQFLLKDNKKKNLRFPLKEIAQKIFNYTEYHIVENTNQNTIYKLNIDLTGQSITASYTNFGTLHSGASVSGSIILKREDQTIINVSFSGYKDPPFMLTAWGGGTPGYETAEKAPVDDAFANSNYYSKLFEVAHKVAGINPIIAALKDKNDLIRSGAVKTILAVKYELPISIIEKLLADNYYTIYTMGLDLLSGRKEPSVVEILLNLLKKRNQANIVQIISLLKQHNDPRIHDAIRNYCLTAINEKDLSEKETAIRLSLENKILLPINVISKLADNKEYTIRSMSIDLLAEREEPESTALLLKLLAKSNYSEMKKIINLLSKKSDPTLNDKVQKNILSMLSSKDEYLREDAVSIINEMQYELPFSTIEKLMSDKSESVRFRSTELLFNRTEPRVIDFLLKSLAKETGEKRVSQIINALSKFDNPKIEKSVIKYAEIDNAVIKKSVLGFLSKSKTPTSLETLLKFVNDKDLSIRLAALNALSERKDPRVTELLIKSLSDTNEKIRIESIKLLGTLNDSTAVVPLINLLSTKIDLNQKKQIVASLKQLNFRSAVPLLTEHYFRLEKIQEVKLDIEPIILKFFQSYSNLSSLAEAKYLPGFLFSKDAKLQGAAIKFLKNLSDTNSQRYYIEMLNDRDTLTALNGALALGYFNNPNAIEPLIDILKNDSRWRVRYRAIEALGFLKSKDALPLIISTLKDVSPDMRHIAAYSLGYLGDTLAVDPLINSLQDNNILVRFYAISSLGNLKIPRAAKSLIKILQTEKDLNSLKNTVVALGKIKAEESIDILISKLTLSLDLREFAEKALISIGSKNIITKLLPVLRDKNFNVRKHAANVFAALKDPRSINPLIESMDRNTDKSSLDSINKALESITGISNIVGYQNWLNWWEDNKSKYNN
jgi:HEAT repeat protein